VYLLLGSPGIGKTQIVRKFAKDKGVNVVTLLCSQQLPNEIVGTHVPDLYGGSEGMKYFPPSWYFDLKDGDILFLDEMLTAPKSVLAAMLTMVESRILQNSKTLPDIMIVAAANPTGSPAQIDAAIRDRFQVVEIQDSKAASAKYLASKYGGDYSYISDILEVQPGAVWNQMTPRTVEKLIMQMETVYENKDQDISNNDTKMFDNLYSRGVALKAVQWWNDRAEKIRNSAYHQAVEEVNNNPLEYVRQPLMKACVEAIVANPSLTNHKSRDIEDVPIEFVQSKTINQDVINAAKRRSSGLSTRIMSTDRDELMAITKEYDKQCIEEEVDKLFGNRDMSTIIGSLEGTPLWDNVKDILEKIQLVDVEVSE